MRDYKKIFELIIETIIRNSSYEREIVLSRFAPFDKFNFEDFDDDYLYKVLAYVPFYAGMKSKTVTSKINTIKSYFSDFNKVASFSEDQISEILSDPNMIKNNKKVRAAVKNAKTAQLLARKYGSFKNYLSNLNFNRSDDDLEKARQTLMNNFSYLGKVTVDHFLTDIGAKIIKPDRVIMRILTRLQLVANTSSHDEAKKVCKRMSSETGHKFRYIDIVIVKFGHRDDDLDTGISNGICLEKNPRCTKCFLYSHYCRGLKRTPNISTTIMKVPKKSSRDIPTNPGKPINSKTPKICGTQNDEIIFRRLFSSVEHFFMADMYNQSHAINKAFYQILLERETISWDSLLVKANQNYLKQNSEIKLKRLKTHFWGDGNWTINRQLAKSNLKIRTDQTQQFWLIDLETFNERKI